MPKIPKNLLLITINIFPSFLCNEREFIRRDAYHRTVDIMQSLEFRWWGPIQEGENIKDTATCPEVGPGKRDKV